MKIFSFFKKKKVKEEKKVEIKQNKKNILHYDTVKNIMYLDDVEYRFDIESEDRLQELHRQEKLTFYKSENGIDTFQLNMINTFLKLDRQLLINFMLVSQNKFKKHEYDDFKKYIYKIMDEHKIENSLIVYCYEMYLRYLENGNFPNVLERGLETMLLALQQQQLTIIQTSPKYIKNIVDYEMEKIILNSQS